MSFREQQRREIRFDKNIDRHKEISQDNIECNNVDPMTNYQQGDHNIIRDDDSIQRRDMS
jgi:hypothetical protein